MPTYRITVRHGVRTQRYHTFDVQADGVAEALRRAAEGVPRAVADEADLVEVRVAPDPQTREYLGDD